MTKRIRTIAAIAVAGAVALSGSLAGAHQDFNPDGKKADGKRCDTWYRSGHDKSGTDGRHSEDHTSEFDNGKGTDAEPVLDALAGTGLVYVHQHTGHYVVRNDYAYVEVVGGGGYAKNGNQGGYVQGEVDAAEGAPDVDFHADTFAGTNSPQGLPAHGEAAGCLSVADNKVGDEGPQP